MLWTILVILVVMWALGLGFGVAGSLIHILLVVALVVLVINLLQGRRVGSSIRSPPMRIASAKMYTADSCSHSSRFR